MNGLELAIAAAMMGAVQGITEFLPISSTAHLTVLPRLLGWSHPLLNSLSFDVTLHLGTLAALLAVQGGEWNGLVRALAEPGSPRGRFAYGLILATIPALLAGALLGHAVETLLRGTMSVALWLALGGILLAAADRFAGRENSGKKRLAGSLSLRDALLVGCAQTLALLPGFSRSGATITAGLLLGLSRREAARYSFLLSAPVIAAACVWEARRLTAIPTANLVPLAVGALCAALTGAAAIRWLLSAVPRLGYVPFAVYRVILAVALAVAALKGLIS
jgi:undecaprenyl-diphosphatase